jgi:hypothetical protein
VTSPVKGDVSDARAAHAEHALAGRPEGRPPGANPRREGELMSLAVVSSSYPLLNIFWTILEVFLWVIWFWVLITIFIDIFRSPDLSGGMKALWFVFVLLIPLIGVLVYLIVRGGSMHDRSVW